MRILIALWLVVSLFVDGAAARFKFPSDETLTVPSLTLTDDQFLRGATGEGRQVDLSGVLRFPNWATKLPVVILLHGSDGPASSSAFRWRDYLNSIGIATFNLDSYGGRGFTQIENDLEQVSSFAQIYDAYRAVEVLSRHPGLDPSRIALMGFSRGGTAALFAAMQRFHRLYGPKAGAIAAYFPFYPACNFKLAEELDVVAAPIREFHGADDDWTPAAPCRDYMQRLKAVGADAAMTEYPGALHAFDNPSSPSRMVLAAAQTSRNCMRRENEGRLVNDATGEPFSYADACVEVGPSVKFDSAATESAHAAVHALLSALFGLK